VAFDSRLLPPPHSKQDDHSLVKLIAFSYELLALLLVAFGYELLILYCISLSKENADLNHSQDADRDQQPCPPKPTYEATRLREADAAQQRR
jgi:hypothetical protein